MNELEWTQNPPTTSGYYGHCYADEAQLPVRIHEVLWGDDSEATLCAYYDGDYKPLTEWPRSWWCGPIVLPEPPMPTKEQSA
jgi:hypothetical protein